MGILNMKLLRKIIIGISVLLLCGAKCKNMKFSIQEFEKINQISRIKNIQNGYKRITKMMIDQGNLLRAGVGISEAFLNNMNLGYSK